jgi:hypothetical protein
MSGLEEKEALVSSHLRLLNTKITAKRIMMSAQGRCIALYYELKYMG